MFDGFSNAVSSLYSSGDLYNNENFFEDKVCPKCKTHESDVRETSHVGCAHCYKVFRDTVSRAAYRLHGRLEHFGKVPARRVSKAEKQREIEVLRAQMIEAAKNEDFEAATALKRKIESLKGEM